MSSLTHLTPRLRYVAGRVRRVDVAETAEINVQVTRRGGSELLPYEII